MSKSAVVKQNQGYLSTLPLGSIIAWHREFDPNRYMPPLPPGWVECNGQVLDDSESPYNGRKIPDLNGESRFLRGHEKSGVHQNHQLQTHKHKDSGHFHTTGGIGVEHASPGGGALDQGIGAAHKNQVNEGFAQIGNPVNAEHGAETRPVNMTVIWIIKVKQVTAQSAIPAIQAQTNAPLGAVYVNGEGNVGIGTATPQAKLEVDGDIVASGRVISGSVKSESVENNEIGIESVSDYTAWLDMPGMGLIEITDNRPVLVIFKAGGVQAYNVAYAAAEFRLIVDNEPKAYCMHQFHNSSGWSLRDVSLIRLLSLPAGAHEIKIQWSIRSPAARQGSYLGPHWHAREEFHADSNVLLEFLGWGETHTHYDIRHEHWELQLKVHLGASRLGDTRSLTVIEL